MKKYPAILAALYNQPQLIVLSKLEEIAFLIEHKMRGASVHGQAVNFEAGERPDVLCVDLDGQEMAIDHVPAAGGNRQFVAVLPLFGTLFQHGDMAMDASGGTSTAQWQREFSRLDANQSVKTIVIEAHTPGGQVWGTQEAADVVRAARDTGRTRIVTVANSQMASAGVWIGTAASEVYVTPGGEVGSIGVVSMHRDISKAEELEGTRTTLIATPAKKVQGHEFAPLDDEALAALQDRNEKTYQRFLQAMSLNRRVSVSRVESDFGGGGMLKADEAVKAGLADGVATFAQVMDREVARLKMAGRKSVKNRAALAGLEVNGD